MIEVIVREYLLSALEDVHVLMEEPEEIEETYVTIEKTGSSMRNRIKRATLAIQSYGGSKYAAAALNERVKTAMDGIVALDAVGGCHLVSDYDFTDSERKKYRYQAVFEIVHYE